MGKLKFRDYQDFFTVMESHELDKIGLSEKVQDVSRKKKELDARLEVYKREQGYDAVEKELDSLMAQIHSADKEILNTRTLLVLELLDEALTYVPAEWFLSEIGISLVSRNYSLDSFRETVKYRGLDSVMKIAPSGDCDVILLSDVDRQDDKWVVRHFNLRIPLPVVYSTDILIHRVHKQMQDCYDSKIKQSQEFERLEREKRYSMYLELKAEFEEGESKKDG